MNENRIVQTLKEKLIIMKSKKIEKYTLSRQRWKMFTVFALWVTLLLPFSSKAYFIDEIDNMIGGMSVASGLSIYGDYYSQHMPVSYYIFAIFRMLGANSIQDYRNMFFIMLAIIWIAMFIHYKKEFNIITMAIYPFLYVAAMARDPITTAAVVSDHLQAQGFVILLLEFLSYNRHRTLSWSNGGWISVAIILSFGTTFTSIYGVFIIAIGILVVGIKHCVIEKYSISKIHSAIVVPFSKVAFCVLLPFGLLLIWYLATNNIDNFIYQAYVLNRSIYAKYNGSFGSNVIAAPITAISTWFMMIWEGGLLQVLQLNSLGLINLIFVIASIALFIKLQKQYGNTVVVILVLFFSMSGIRSFEGFHAMPYFALSAMVMSMLFSEFNLKELPVMKQVMVVVVLVIMVVPYATYIRSARPPLQKISEYGALADAIALITEENEFITIATLDYGIAVESNRTPINIGFEVPWMYEALADDAFEKLIRYMPKVVVLNTGHTIWGHNLADYGPEGISFITDNYMQIDPNLGFLYVRNDYANEAKSILGIH